jgi:hypothetical protein
MPSHSRALEASFESSDKHSSSGADPVPMFEDFDSFFEKLNTLDKAEWRKDAPPAAARPAGSSAGGPTGKPAAKPVSRADALAGLKAAVAEAKLQAQQAPRMEGKPIPPALPPRRRVAGALRFALAAVLLFIVGMGIGWLALSLPGRSDSTAAARSETVVVIEPKPDAGLLKSGDPMAKMGTLMPLVESAPKSTPGSTSPAAGVAEPVLPVDLAAAKVANAEALDHEGKADATDTSAWTKADPSPTAPAATTLAPSTTGAAVVTSTKTPVKPSTSKGARTRPAKGSPTRSGDSAAVAAVEKSATAIPESAASPSTGSTSGRYAVQVGACRSAKCVDTYRRLVQTHLTGGAEQVRVLPVPAEGSDSQVQRIRIAPLDKAEAMQLQSSLAQADPRLRGAYVVAVHP